MLGLYREEVFGPVLAVVKYSTDAEAVALANDCPFGLGSTVFSGSKTRANAIAQQLQVEFTGCNIHVVPSCSGFPQREVGINKQSKLDLHMQPSQLTFQALLLAAVIACCNEHCRCTTHAASAH